MVESSETMLAYAFKTLSKGGKGKKAEEKIYRRDQRINFTEREIRKRVLVHLAVNKTANLPEYLGLISIAKDAERLGDYVKNVYELKQLTDGIETTSPLFETLFTGIGGEMLDLFTLVTSAFRDCDRECALKAISTGGAIADRCESIILDIIATEKNVPQAVVLALGARYLKRIARHLTNIASSVVNPMPDLDFSTTVDD